MGQRRQGEEWGAGERAAAESAADRRARPVSRERTSRTQAGLSGGGVKKRKKWAVRVGAARGKRRNCTDAFI